MQHCLVQPELHRRPLEHLALVRVCGYQPVDLDIFRLPNPVAPRLRLDVVLRIPVRIVNNDSVCRSEVDADAARACAKEEDKYIRSFLRETVDPSLAIRGLHRSVQPFVRVRAIVQVVFQYVQHPDHLRENEHPVALGLQLRKELVHEHELAAGQNHFLHVSMVLLIGVGLSIFPYTRLRHPREILGQDRIFCAVKQEWVIATLAQLHADVDERRL
mmetsp:Transcript_6942/g.13213  ORF Transcript_6942/g.13213 Transcript_6942/m.13213 type:complete len:216 (+) Transcript_6942:1287-1934(+)